MTQETRSPAFGLSGLTGGSNPKRVSLPLKAVKCGFSITAGLTEVAITQVFRHENDEPLDVRYLFPLPADAAVYSCEITLGDRTLRAQVEERAQARELARKKKAEGRRTALVEAERENLFTLSLGNVQPGDLVEVRLRYFQPVRRAGDGLAIEIPFCPGVRYIPGKPLLR